jgi:hypothetical protein
MVANLLHVQLGSAVSATAALSSRERQGGFLTHCSQDISNIVKNTAATLAASASLTGSETNAVLAGVASPSAV